METPNSAYSAVYTNPNLFCSQCPQSAGSYPMKQQTPVPLPQLPGNATPQNQQFGMTTTGPASGTGTMMQSAAQSQLMAPITDLNQPMPMTVESLQYLNGFMRTQVGRKVLVDFLLGTNTFTDKSGILMGVGANYILLKESDSDDIVACDFFNIKFIKFYH